MHINNTIYYLLTTFFFFFLVDGYNLDILENQKVDHKSATPDLFYHVAQGFVDLSPVHTEVS